MQIMTAENKQNLL